MSNKIRIFTIIAAFGALLGLFYSAYSTYDFMAHLDRQLHPVNCSLLPGLTDPGQLTKEAEGCKTAMFSVYSSFWRDRYWGGVPISLAGLGLFLFALMLAAWGAISGQGQRFVPSLFLLLTGLVAVGTSLVMFFISITELGSLCKLCVGTYLGSGLLLLGAALAFFAARRERQLAGPLGPRTGEAAVLTASETSPMLVGAILAVELGLAILVPHLIYVYNLPDYSKYVGSCEVLKAREDKQGVLLNLGRMTPAREVSRAAQSKTGTDAVLVLDPLCPACHSFHRRIAAAPIMAGLEYKLLLLPLDAECNWMLTDSMHPGACLLSKALICAGEKTREVLDFIYESQEELRIASTGRKLDQIRQQVLARYPELGRCIDSNDTKIKLTKTLQYAVKNSLPVLTPQLYVNSRRLCDEDTDLGLDFAMGALLQAAPYVASPTASGAVEGAPSPVAPVGAPTAGSGAR